MIIAISCSFLGSRAQLTLGPEPEVGKKCPNFELDTIDFYSKKKVKLEDFKGKWLILDFWAKNCSSCISSFPKISKLQKELQDTVQFVMVTYDDTEHEHRQMYANYHKALHLQMPSAFAGTLNWKTDISTGLWHQFNIGLLPHTIMIDPNGIVRAITSGGVNESKLKDLIRGKEVQFSKPSFAREKKEEKDLLKFDQRIPFEVNGNGAPDSDFMYRSLFSKWRPEIPSSLDRDIIPDSYTINHRKNLGRYEAVGVDLITIYKAAFFGTVSTSRDSALRDTYWPKPILQLTDSSIFQIDHAIGKNLFCYSLVVPKTKATKQFMMDVMQSDLQHYLGFDAKIEIKEMPYWRLIVTTNKTKTKIKALDSLAKDSYDEIYGAGQGGIFKSYSMKSLVALISHYTGFESDAGRAFIVDETGIKGKIDLTVHWFVNDLSGIRQALQKNGLDIVPGKKEMKVLVIRDPKPTIN